MLYKDAGGLEFFGGDIETAGNGTRTEKGHVVAAAEEHPLNMCCVIQKC